MGIHGFGVRNERGQADPIRTRTMAKNNEHLFQENPIKQMDMESPEKKN